MDLSLLYILNMKIPRVIDVKTIPEDQVVFLQYLEHFGSYLLFHVGGQH